MIRKGIQLLLLLLFIWIFLKVNNQWLKQTTYDIQSERIPEAFNGLKIVQLSDLHDATFGHHQSKLAARVKAIDPDLLFITGDLIDSNRYNLKNSLDLIDQLTPMAHIYYVTGNHEVAMNKIDEITNALQQRGVHVLTNEAIRLEKDGENIVIAGIEDPLMKGLNYPDSTVAHSLQRALQNVVAQDYTLLLSHRPEVFDVYVDRQVDLVFTGHAHGGQIRIPGLGGLVAPGQGWFPKYSAGKYTHGITTMIVHRGLGNSIIPFRIFNRPELVVVTLKSK